MTTSDHEKLGNSQPNSLLSIAWTSSYLTNAYLNSDSFKLKYKSIKPYLETEAIITQELFVGLNTHLAENDS